MQKDDAQKEEEHRFVHNSTNQSISWSTSSVTSRSITTHKHSHNDKNVRETIAHQVASGDTPDGTLGALPFDIDDIDRIEMLEMKNLAEWDYPIFTLSDVVPSTILSMVSGISPYDSHVRACVTCKQHPTKMDSYVYKILHKGFVAESWHHHLAQS